MHDYKFDMTSEPLKSYKVEYLCTINSDGDFCTTISSFSSLLESYEKLRIDGSKLFWGEKEFKLEIYDGEVLNSKHKFFHIKLTNPNIENKNEFLSVLKVIRTILSKVNNNQPPEILWDDLSSEYAVLSYPIIHELENLMRKLITKFMVVKVGLSWTKENIPREVSESLKNVSVAKKQNYIYDTDFIQLSNFLFKEYTTAKIEDFIENINKANNVSDLKLEDLKKLVPSSNWTRYFNPIVECTSDELSTKWDKLYKLRCKVAHNNFMDEDDFNNLVSNSQSVKSIIQDAIDNLDKVNIKEEDKEDLAENAAINLNKMYGEYVIKWKDIDKIFSSFTIAQKNGRKYSTSLTIKELLFKGIITQNEFKKLNELLIIRNMIVHESNYDLDEISLNSALKDLVFWEDRLLKLAISPIIYNGHYEISQNVEDLYRFVLKSYNGEIILSSELYEIKENAISTIDFLRNININIRNFDILTASNGKEYFNLISNNNQIIGTSQFYNDIDEINAGLTLVKRTLKTSKIIDLTSDYAVAST